MPSWTFITSLVLRSLVLVALTVLALGLVARFAYGVEFRAGSVGGLVVYILLGTFTFCCLGAALTTFTRSTEAASALAPFSVVILSFISGVFIPVEQLPEWLAEHRAGVPARASRHGTPDCALSPSADSTGLSAENLGVLAAWGVGGLLLAARGRSAGSPGSRAGRSARRNARADGGNHGQGQHVCGSEPALRTIGAEARPVCRPSPQAGERGIAM